jgi:hypothetical protein
MVQLDHDAIESPTIDSQNKQKRLKKQSLPGRPSGSTGGHARRRVSVAFKRHVPWRGATDRRDSYFPQLFAFFYK